MYYLGFLCKYGELVDEFNITLEMVKFVGLAELTSVLHASIPCNKKAKLVDLIDIVDEVKIV